MKGGESCTGWCAPTIIYLVLGIIGIALSMMVEKDPAVTENDHMRFKTTAFFAQLIFLVFWTGLLYLLCSYCHTGWAWALLIGMFLLGLLIPVLLFAMAAGFLLKAKKDEIRYEHRDEHRDEYRDEHSNEMMEVEPAEPAESE